MLPSGRAQDCTQVVPTALEDLELEERVRDLCFDNSELVNGACTYPNQAEAGSARPPPGLRERAPSYPDKETRVTGPVFGRHLLYLRERLVLLALYNPDLPLAVK